MSGALSWALSAERVSVETPDQVKAAILAPGDQPLVPTVTGSSLRRGNPPGGPVRLLDLSALNGVTEYEPEDMTVTAKAGTPLESLQEVLAPHGQWLPVDPFSRGSVGGLIGADRRSPLAGSLGTVRDHLIGVRYVDGRGRDVRAGGRVVKNVAGYDLMKLLIGSLGEMGVMVEATFKVLPKPARWGGVCLAEPGEDDIHRARMELARAWMPTGLWRMDRGNGEELIAVVAGTDTRVRAQEDAFRNAWGSRARSLGETEGLDLLKTHTGWSEDGDSALGWGGALPAFLGESPLCNLFPRTPWSADLLRGHFWCRLLPEDTDRVPGMRREFAGGEGHLHLDGSSAGETVWGRDPGPEAEIWRRLKQAADPEGRLGHGRLPGGV